MGVCCQSERAGTPKREEGKGATAEGTSRWAHFSPSHLGTQLNLSVPLILEMTSLLSHMETPVH